MLRIDYAGLRVLVIEDNAAMRRILRTWLAALGIGKVIEAEDGVAGVTAATVHAPDIVITDWELPRLDGLAVTARLRDPDASLNPFVPIIMLTAHTERQRVLLARDSGVTEYLAKPLSGRALFQRLVTVVANPRAFVRDAAYFGPDRRRLMPTGYVGAERRNTDGAGGVLILP